MTGYLRKFLKLLLPPIVTNGFTSPPEKQITYEGRFNGFSDVSSTYHNTVNYDSDTSLEKTRKKAIQELVNFKNGHPPNLSYDLIRLNLLSVSSSMVAKDELNYLDIGGGLGASYLNLLYSCPIKKINFTLMDLAETVAIGKDLFKDHGTIEFITEFPTNRVGKFDIIHLASSLQYFEDYRVLLNSCCQLQPKYIFILDTTMGPAPTFACAQVNVADITIPRWVFNIDELIEIMKSGGFDVVYKSVNYYSFHDFSNYTGYESNTQKYNLIFQKKA